MTVCISSLRIGNGFWSRLTGEWRGAPRRAAIAVMAGIAVQVAGILVLFLVMPA